MRIGRKAHEFVSRRVLLPMWRIQRRLRPSRRAVAAAIAEGLAFRRATQNWSDERKSAWILERLRFSVRRAYYTTAYYRRVLDEIGFEPDAAFRFEDFARIPVLERETVREASAELISRDIPAHLLTRDSTGGSTGTPTVVWIGPQEMGWKESAGIRFQEMIGAPQGVPTALLWGHHLDPTGHDNWREKYHSFEANTRWFDCLRLSPAVLERYHREFERRKPHLVVAYASAAAHLAEYVLESGYTASYGTRRVVTGAEKLFSDQREKIERAFRCPAHERYGGRDVGYLAFQMRRQGSLDYDVDWPNTLMEPETSEPESAILVTKLHADGMPMLRYRVGDLARFPAGSHPGHPALILHEVTGRDTDRIWLPQGGWITGLQIPHLMKDYPVREYQVIQRRDYSVEIQIVPKAEFSQTDHRLILGSIQANLPGVKVVTAFVDEVLRNKASKWRPVVSEVDRAMRKSA